MIALLILVARVLICTLSSGTCKSMSGRTDKMPQYLGGKKTLQKAICAFLESHRKQNQPFYDLSCGMASIVAGMSGERYASDISQSLITLLQRAQDGWKPPENVSETEYQQIKATKDPLDPMTAFVGFGCSYGGKFFGGYARDPKNGRNFAATAARSLAKLTEQCKGVTFTCEDMLATDCEGRFITTVRDGAMVYLDPPYAATTIAYDCPAFDFDEFWRFADELSNRCSVFVSEYAAPTGWSCVWQAEVRKSRFAGVKVERIFTRSR